MSISFILCLVAAALGALLLGGLRRWARSLPVAHAWNPETHDRQVCVALDILRADDPPRGPVTLFGWVLRKLADKHHNLWDEYIGQIRRGAIEEDMNSHAINEFEAASSLADAALVAGALIITPWLWAFLAAKKLGGWGLEQVEGISGANGSYHFYNPKKGDDSQAGLTEPTYIANVLSSVSKSIGSGTLVAPMPSAVTRALDPSAHTWSFDYEDRNYTYTDAQRYVRMGYPALGFYALGRVLHLLQDMAVPAHVRDDSHLGIELPEPYGEPSDPLEKLAGKLDWASTNPPGDPEASNTVKWTYQPRRAYATVGSGLYGSAQKEFGRLRSRAKGVAPLKHFFDLATWSHDGFYSLGTIPGNPDSHNPDDTKVQPWWRGSGAVDRSKCAPNVEGYRKTLMSMAGNMRTLVEHHHVTMSLYEGRLAAYSGDRTQAAILRGQIEAAKQYDEELFVEIDRGIIPRIGAAATSHAGLVALAEAIIPMARRMAAMTDPSPNYSPYSTSRWSHSAFVELQQQVEAMDLERLLEVAGSTSDTTEALREYIIGYGADERRLALAFKPAMPFCLPPSMLRTQYNETAPRAAARCAALMADWFESLYAPDEGRGVGLWQNANAESGEIPTAYQVEQSSDATAVKTFGVTNHLPAPIEMTCEFTLVELTDANTGARVDDRQVAVNVTLAHVSAAEGAEGLDVRGRTEQGVRVKLRGTGSFTFGTTPHAMGVQRAYQWPEKGTWGGGAIRREEEVEKLKPVNLTPGQAPKGVTGTAGDGFYATFLRVEGRMAPEEEES